ncbi:hypothetical protein H5410_051209 [Solanum commersonii]|uniref:Uncharacterized protein n=1 Tax=Solanum commersonii TaxID=4109 RepID=A0A9J5X026_SOLCO|nr:hypothetical protein H5410_051209 [Solanum commersonii]
MESKGFKLSKIKTKYLECKFSGVTYVANVEVTLDKWLIQKRGRFKYIGSIIQENGEIGKDVTHLLDAGYLKLVEAHIWSLVC